MPIKVSEKGRLVNQFSVKFSDKRNKDESGEGWAETLQWNNEWTRKDFKGISGYKWWANIHSNYWYVTPYFIVSYTYIVSDGDTWLPHLIPPVNIQDA